MSPGTTVVTLQALEPMYIDFHLPQQAVDRIAVGQPVTARVDTSPDQRFTGTISAINPEVDTETRNVAVRATLANPDHKLLPGMFATVTVNAGAPQRYLTLPQTAITYNSYGNSVYLVEEKGQNANSEPPPVARQTFVTTGPTRGDQVAVLSGIKEGGTVVTAGQIKLQNGSPLSINNAVEPTDDPAPSVPAQ